MPIVYSLKTISEAKKPADQHYNFGYKRQNLLAAFVNATFLIYQVFFTLLESMHHIAEHLHTEEHIEDIKDGIYDESVLEELKAEEDHFA